MFAGRIMKGRRKRLTLGKYYGEITQRNRNVEVYLWGKKGKKKCIGDER